MTLCKLKKVCIASRAFLLEVLGGCGAVWGCSEAFNVRGGPNNDQWRVVSGVVGALCLLRWVCLHPLSCQISPDLEVLTAFLLQVFGGVGAVWGFAEIVGLRVNYPLNCHDAQFSGVGDAWAPGYSTCQNTYSFWRAVVLMAFVWFVLWWQRDHLAGWPKCAWLRRGIHLASTFVLEVVGGAGALWGFSEVCGTSGHSLRLGWGDRYFGQQSFDQWRVACAGVFVLCFMHWLVVECTRSVGTLTEKVSNVSAPDFLPSSSPPSGNEV